MKVLKSKIMQKAVIFLLAVVLLLSGFYTGLSAVVKAADSGASVSTDFHAMHEFDDNSFYNRAEDPTVFRYGIKQTGVEGWGEYFYTAPDDDRYSAFSLTIDVTNFFGYIPSSSRTADIYISLYPIDGLRLNPYGRIGEIVFMSEGNKVISETTWEDFMLSFCASVVKSTLVTSQTQSGRREFVPISLPTGCTSILFWLPYDLRNDFESILTELLSSFALGTAEGVERYNQYVDSYKYNGVTDGGSGVTEINGEVYTRALSKSNKPLYDSYGEPLYINHLNQLYDCYGSPVVDKANALPIVRGRSGDYYNVKVEKMSFSTINFTARTGGLMGNSVVNLSADSQVMNVEGLTITSGDTLKDIKGYVVRSTGFEDGIYILTHNLGYTFPAKRVVIKPSFMSYIPLFSVLFGTKVDYYDLNGHYIDPSDYDRMFLGFFEQFRKAGEFDFTVPWGEPAKDSDGMQLYDDLDQPIGILATGQLVDPYGRPLVDSNALPLYCRNGQYYSLGDYDAKTGEYELVDNLVLITDEGKQRLRDAAGRVLRSVSKDGETWFGISIIMNDNRTLLPVTQTYLNGSVVYYDMNGNKVVEDTFVPPISLEEYKQAKLEEDIDSFFDTLKGFFSGGGSGCSDGFSGLSTILILVIIMAIAFFGIKVVSLFKK